MGYKIELSKSANKLLNTTSAQGLIPQVRKEFAKKGPIKFRRAILADMNTGISPVKGQRWGAYSASYKKQIDRGTGYLALATGSKTKGIVTLRVTGELWKSLKVYTNSIYFSSFRMIIEFTDFLADIHNRRGAGKIKKVRRMLPTKQGEQFNRTLTKVVINSLKDAASTVVKNFK